MLLTNFAGLRVVVSPHAVETVGHEFNPIRWSQHRSRRIWKKLQKRQRLSVRPIIRPAAFQMAGQIVVHPDIAAELRRRTPVASVRPPMYALGIA